ncbi:MAG: parallel beta-helix repeat protein [Planctomycetota bacterium]|jgi:parallel beta-helix repeat protein
MRNAPTAALVILALGTLCAFAAGQKSLTLTESTTLSSNSPIVGPIVIAANGITIDGGGAVLEGPGQPGKPTTRQGIGILAEGRSDITLKNFTVRGFESALVIRGGGRWNIENCNFSDNYNDPEYGWGDGERVGGMILTDVTGASIKNCLSQRNWNGLDLWNCNEIDVVKCNFSHCANVCLKMWSSSRNTVRDCDLSYGLRIRAGEVHARDSTCVLMESGSNNNTFSNNDITHGGDGVFIRVLNGWVSTGNVFRNNDCSYANNNGFEAWSPGNTYIDNTSNHCSYGFWLGGSDRTVLTGNTASYNGLKSGFHNAPESDFGHGGIVIVHGTGSHTLIDSNTCIGNRGGGIVFRGDLGTKGAKWQMRHLVVQRNHLQENAVGIFGRFTRGLVLSSNTFVDNGQETAFEDVLLVRRLGSASDNDARPVIELQGPSVIVAGQTARFSANGSRTGKSGDGEKDQQLTYCWRLGQATGTNSEFAHTFDQPGFYSLSLTVDDGRLAALAHRDIYVVDSNEHDATEQQTSSTLWKGNQNGRGQVDLTLDDTAIVGDHSLRLRAATYSGAEVQVSLHLPGETLADLSNTEQMSFWLRFQNANNGGFQGPNPTVRLHSGSSAFSYTPADNGLPRNLLGDLPYSEARTGWVHIRIPLAGGPDWHRSTFHEGSVPPFVSKNLEFTTLDTNLATRGSASLAASSKRIYCASGDVVHASPDGQNWQALPTAKATLGAAPQWINGMLTFAGALGEQGSLLLTAPAQANRANAENQHQLIVFDIASQEWRWHHTITAMGHGGTMVGNKLFGLAHAIGGNYGGPLCRVDVMAKQEFDDHSVLGNVAGDNAWWFSRAAQLATHNGHIYAIKNDWITPQPDAKATGDRLLVFDPKTYATSQWNGGKRWSDKSWRQQVTPATDLGPLPFEIGHGAALVALPAHWNSIVGARGGLFLVAGCSPSDHEGHGRASDLWAIYDIATKSFSTGRLPATTGSGSSACLFRDRLHIKRGGVQDGTDANIHLWTVRALSPADANAAIAHQVATTPDLRKVDRLSLQFDSSGREPFTIWIDGLLLSGLPE